MKRITAVLAALLLAVLLCVALLPFGMPQIATAAVTADGQQWAVENRSVSAYLYRISDHHITALHRITTLQGQTISPVIGVGQLDGAPCVAQQTAKNIVFMRWAEERWQPMADAPFTKNWRLLDWQGDLTMQDPAGEIRVYRATGLIPSRWKEIYHTAPPVNWNGTDVTARTDGLYCKLSDGKTMLERLDGQRSIVDTPVWQTLDLSKLPMDWAVRLRLKLPWLGMALGATLLLLLPLPLCGWLGKKSRQLHHRFIWYLVGILGFLMSWLVLFELLWVSKRLSPVQALSFLLQNAVLFPLLLLLGFLLLRVMSRATQLDLQSVLDRMERMEDGDYTVPNVSKRQDEVGDLHASLQRLCVGLSIRKYEVDMTMEAYHRFVPQGLEKLIDRANVTEVSLGDSRTITGVISLLSVSNRHNVRRLLSDDQYSDFVGYCTELVDTSAREHGGMLLASEYDFATCKLYFEKHRAAALTASLDLLGKTAEGAKDGSLPRPRFGILLHEATFLYGITGGSETIFPFVSSIELEFLSGFSNRLCAAGCSLVATDRYLAGKQRENSRYIGFVSATDAQTIKLYELLEVYPSIERNQRLHYDSQFQEGIRLFYQSDFYLARSIFSSVLKICPADGIARWYLFACERYFHETSKQNIHFGLFSANFEEEKEVTV